MMSDKLSREDAAELLRVLHEDQGLRNPGFSQKFAFRLIEVITGWFDEERTYSPSIWFERWESQAPAVRLEPAAPPSNTNHDDIPF